MATDPGPAPSGGLDDTQRLLQGAVSFSRGALEVSQRPGRLRHVPERPRPLPTAAALASLLLVVLCTGWLVFGPTGSSAGTTQVAGVPPACQPLATGPFYDYAIPTFYNLSLSLPPPLFAVDLAAPGLGSPGGFNASVAIRFDVLRPARCLLLHAAGMRFAAASLEVATGPSAAAAATPAAAPAAVGSGGAGERVLCSSPEACVSIIVPVAGRSQQSTLDQDLVAVDLGGSTVLQPGSTAVLRLAYTGTLGDGEGAGLYRSDPFVAPAAGPAGSGGNGAAIGSSDSSSGSGSGTGAAAGGRGAAGGSGGSGDSARATVLLVTQLEPTYARRLLPCYDAPRFKAQFQLGLEVPPGLVALSNMPERQRAPVPGRPGMEALLFDRTPAMSPYLLAVAVGELEQLEGGTAGSAGPELRLWAVPGKACQLRVAAAAAAGSLRFFAQWTGIPQPLPKFDYVAVPGKGGAMENWGLLLFDERRFLVNEATEGAYGAWLAADVVAHETAHQWFGNLVTCEDWTQLALNEGVASFMEYQAAAAALPALPALPLLFRATTPSSEALGIHEGPTQRALGHAADPLLPPLVPTSELKGSDGVVTYSQGAGLLRMLEAFVEAQQTGAFRAGFQAFMRQHLNSTATLGDLLSALADQLAAAPDGGASGGAASSSTASIAAAQSFVQLARQYSQLAAATAGRNGGINAATTAANPLGAWLHQPGVPLVNASTTGALQQWRYCSWQLPQQLLAQLGGPEGSSAGGEEEHGSDSRGTSAGNAASCAAEGVRWWLPQLAPAASALLAAASQDSGGGGSGGSGEAIQLVNMLGAGLFRTAYSEAQLQQQLSAVAALAPCYRSSNGSSGGTAAGACSGSGVWLGSTSCRAEDSNSSSCQMDAGPLLAAAGVLADALALAGDGAYPAAVAVEAAQAAAKAPISATGAGAHLLLLPAADALGELRLAAAGHSGQCAAQLDALAAQLLAPHAVRVLERTWPGSSVRALEAPELQDAFLGQLAAGQLAWQAALAGDASTAAALCSSLPATPLWQHMSATAQQAAGSDGAALPCPAGFQPAAAHASNASLPAVGCQREAAGSGEAAGSVPGGLKGGLGGGPTPDLLPAVYVAAAQAPGCGTALPGAGENVSAVAVARGLMHCWEAEADEAEASRCLHALPYVGDEGGLQEALAWLLRSPPTSASTAGDTANCAAGAGTSMTAALPLAQQVLLSNRRRALPGRLPALLRAAAQRSPAAWRSVVGYLQGRWQRAAQCGLLPGLCSTLQQLSPAPSAADAADLEAFVLGVARGPAEVRCSQTAFTRALGQGQRRLQDVQRLCDAVEQALGG